MRWVLRLYPSSWRSRYEEEFVALLEERQLSAGDAVDIALAALGERIHPQVQVERAVDDRLDLMPSRWAASLVAMWLAGSAAALLLIGPWGVVPITGVVFSTGIGIVGCRLIDIFRQVIEQTASRSNPGQANSTPVRSP